MTKWIQKATASGKGKLHKNLNVASDKKIPEKKIEKATHSKNPTIRKEANLAKTLSKIRHKNSKKG